VSANPRETVQVLSRGKRKDVATEAHESVANAELTDMLTRKPICSAALATPNILQKCDGA